MRALSGIGICAVKLGEIGSGTSTVTGALPMELKDSWGLFAHIHLSHKGRLN